MDFVLSIGRHEEHSFGSLLPLTEMGIVRAWMSGSVIQKQLGCPQMIMASPLARAAATALLRKASLGGSVSLLECEQLHENSSRYDVSRFENLLYETVVKNNLTHIHLVTHAPVASLLNGGQPCRLGCGDILVLKAGSWEDILAGNAEKSYIYMNQEISLDIGFELRNKIFSHSPHNLPEIIDILKNPE